MSETTFPALSGPRIRNGFVPQSPGNRLKMLSRLNEQLRGLGLLRGARRVRRARSPERSVEPLEARVLLTTFSVANTADSGSGSLRFAIEQANASPGADVIEFSGSVFSDAVPDQILLTSGRIAITDDVTIQGPGASLLTISAGGQSQLFSISGAATDVTIDSLTLTGGSAAGTTFDTQSGGAVYNNDGRLTLVGSVLSGNSAAVDGGGLYNLSGTVTLAGTSVTGNTAGNAGGGLASNGLLIVTAGEFSGNAAPYGGAIAVGRQGTLDLRDSALTGNSASIDAAGVLNYRGSATISNSTFEQNSSVRGGTVSNSGMLLLVDGTFVGNSATYGGGATNVDGGTMSVVRTTFLNNTATRDGGGLFTSSGGNTLVVDSTFVGNSGGLVGGALANVRTGSVTVLRSTMSANSSNYGGAIANIYGAIMTVTNSTISGNAAGDSGGGILNDGVLTVTASTIVLNRSDRPQGGGGGVFTNTTFNTVTRLFNMIVAGNVRAQSTGLVPNNLGGKSVAAESAYNLIASPGTTGGLVHGVNGNIVGAAGTGGSRVLLPLEAIVDATLADNGGPTRTHALVAGSVAIDNGSNALAIDANGAPLTTDQRGTGYARIAGASVDIGAFER